MIIANIIILSLMILGCINWFLVGVFSWNLVTWIFGLSIFTRILYAIIGLAGIWMLIQLCLRGAKLFRDDSVRAKNSSK